MEKEYSVILLTASGDFLLEEEKQLCKKEHGVKAKTPYVINESGEAQRVKAKELFVPYASLDSIQYGEFNHETLK